MRLLRLRHLAVLAFPSAALQPLAPAPAPAAAVDDEGDAVMAAITKESERAMEKLDEAISSSWELLEGEWLAADAARCCCSLLLLHIGQGRALQ